MSLFDLLHFEEGYRSKAYYCSEGYPTIGIGTKIGPKGAPLEHYTFAVNKEIAEAMLYKEMDLVWTKVKSMSFYKKLNDDRKAIIDSMCYQLGVNGLLKFKRMITALEQEDYKAAALEALDSRWYAQTPKRAIRHATVLEHGSLMQVYEGLI